MLDIQLCFWQDIKMLSKLNWIKLVYKWSKNIKILLESYVIQKHFYTWMCKTKIVYLDLQNLLEIKMIIYDISSQNGV